MQTKINILGRILRATAVSAVVCWVATGPAHGEDSKADGDQTLHEIIERLSGEASRNYMTFDFGRARDNRAVSVVVTEEQAFKLVPSFREQLPAGFVAFVGTNRWLGDEDHSGMVEVVVAEGQDQYDILRLARTDAVNHGMMTDDLIEWFKANEPEISFDILQASTDTIFGSVLRGPKNMDRFVEKLYEFCPDIVDQGSGNKDDLRGMIGEHRMLYLWWD